MTSDAGRYLTVKVTATRTSYVTGTTTTEARIIAR